MKPWKAVVVLITLGFIALVILFSLGGVGVSKKSNTSSSSSSTSSSKVVESSKSSESSSKPLSEESTTEVESSRSEARTSTSSTETTVTEPKSGSLTSVEYPDIVSEGSSRAVISKKSVYQINDTYVFCLTLTLPTEELGTVEVEYFTSANNYNSVKIGTLLVVEYGVSSNGVVALAVVDTIQ